MSDYVVDEVMAFLVARGASARNVRDAIAFVLGSEDEPSPFQLRFVSADAFAAAVVLLPRHRDRGLSFTDCTTLALMAATGVRKLATFDRGFDGLVDVVR